MNSTRIIVSGIIITTASAALFFINHDSDSRTRVKKAEKKKVKKNKNVDFLNHEEMTQKCWN